MATDANNAKAHEEALAAAIGEFEGTMARVVSAKDALRETIDRERWEHEHRREAVPDSDLFNPDAIAARAVEEVDEKEYSRRRHAQLTALSRHIGEDSAIVAEAVPELGRIAEASRIVEASLLMDARTARAHYNAAAAELACAEKVLSEFRRNTNGRILGAYKKAVCSGDEYGSNEYRREGLSTPQNTVLIGMTRASQPVSDVCSAIAQDLRGAAEARKALETIPAVPEPQPVYSRDLGSTGPWHF